MSHTTSSNGIGTLGLLGVLFVGLKLTGYIDWSWWLVTLPFWIGIPIIIVMVIIIIILNAKGKL